MCVGSSPLSLITTRREETPALRFRAQALPLVPCVSWPLASPPLPPSLSPLPSSLSISPPPPAAAKESQRERMREQERGREEGGGLRLAAGRSCDSRQRTEGPSTSCPAHASLKTSVAIDNSCRATHQPQIPRHKAIGWQDLWPPPLLWGEHVGTCSPICGEGEWGV